MRPILVAALAIGLSLAATALPAADRTILCVTDEHVGAYLDTVPKAFGTILARRGVKLGVNDKKGQTVADLHGSFEREVLKKKPTTLVLGLGVNDLWDFRKKQAVAEANERATLALLADMVRQAKEAGIAVTLVTPPTPPVDAAEQAVVTTYAAALIDLAREHGATVLDFARPTTADGAYDKKGRLSPAITEDLVLRAARSLGVSPESLPALAVEDRVVFFSDAARLATMLEREPLVQEAFARRFGEKRHLVFLEKDLGQTTKEPEFIVNQRPRSLLLCYGHRHLAGDQPADAFKTDLDALLDTIGKAPYDPIILVTPLPLNDSGQVGPWNPDGPRGKLVLTYAQACREIAQRRGLAVIDLTAEALAYRAGKPTAFFMAQKDAASTYVSASLDGGALVSLTLRKAWGME